MFGDLKATLYDLFGYLIPGLVSVLAISVALPAVAALPLPPLVANMGAAFSGGMLLLGAYLAGHAVHALGNALPPFSRSAEKAQLSDGGVPSILVSRARSLLSEQIGCACDSLPDRDLYELLDESRVLFDSEGDREMYTYREGFYRGMTVSSAILVVALLVALAADSICASPAISAASACWSKPSILGAALIAAASATGFFFRMRRFADYRVRRATYRFLVGLGRTRTTGDKSNV